MREAINQNRTVQLVLLGVLLLAGGFLFLKVTKGSGSQSGATASTSSATAGATGSGSTDSGGVAAGFGSTVASASPDRVCLGGSAGSAPAVPANLIPGPSLPKSLIAGLPARVTASPCSSCAPAASTTRWCTARSRRLNGSRGLSVYATKAQHIARYAWITQGVNLTDLPALVVLLPRKLSKGVPTASVSYGFRDAASVLQAAKDALYRGPDPPLLPPLAMPSPSQLRDEQDAGAASLDLADEFGGRCQAGGGGPRRCRA